MCLLHSVTYVSNFFSIVMLCLCLRVSLHPQIKVSVSIHKICPNSSYLYILLTDFHYNISSSSFPGVRSWTGLDNLQTEFLNHSHVSIQKIHMKAILQLKFPGVYHHSSFYG